MTSHAISPLNAFFMIMLIAFWGSSFVFVKIALREGLTPIAIATFRFLIAGILFLAILFIKKNLKHDYTLMKLKDLTKLAFLALSGVTIFFTVQYTGIQMAGAAIAAILVCLLSPIFITVFSGALFGEHLSKRQLLGISVAAVGTLAIIAGGTLSFQSNGQIFLGSLILLSTPVLWTAYTLAGKKMMESYDPFLVVSLVTLVGGIMLIPFSVAENSLQTLFTTSLSGWLIILYLSITCSLIGYYIWFRVINKVKAAVTSSFLFAEPLVTGVLASILVEEEVTILTVVGGLLVFLGVNLVTRNRD